MRRRHTTDECALRAWMRRGSAQGRWRQVPSGMVDATSHNDRCRAGRTGRSCRRLVLADAVGVDPRFTAQRADEGVRCPLACSSGEVRTVRGARMDSRAERCVLLEGARSGAGLPIGEIPVPVTGSRPAVDGKEPSDHRVAPGVPVGTIARYSTPVPLQHASRHSARSEHDHAVGRAVVWRRSGHFGERGSDGPGAVAGGPRRAPVAGVGICLRFAYVRERDVIQWTVSNTSEHDVRRQDDAVDTFSLPCRQVVPGSSPGVGSVSSQVREVWRISPAPEACL